jgi:CRISPR-associated protein Cmr2
MDGDRMGAWLAADGEMALAHEQSFHPQIRAALAGLSGESAFAAYARAQRAPSPSRHMAISEALNHFALTLAPAVVEARYHGRLLYAGGDDLMALFPVTDLLPAMAELRAAYSGVAADEIGLDRPADDEALFEQQDNGFILHRGRLLRVMGRAASASCGAVIAHHRAPLVAVLRELRAAEARAKEEGGRNAFSLSVVKRAGGALRFTAHWGEPLRVLMRLRAFLCEPAVSRRAVYHSIRWLRELPEPRPGDGMLAALLACQLERQCQKPGVAEAHKLGELCAALVSEALGSAAAGGARAWIENLLAVAEFLARETRGLQGRGAGTEEDAA